MLGGVNLAGELLTDASSWRVLVSYLDAAARIGVPASWPPARLVPGTDFGLIATTAIDALCWGLPDRREVRAAVILQEARRWLTDSPPATPINDAELLGAAAVYVQALCPVPHRPAALDLLDAQPLFAERARQRRRHPIRAIRRPAWPHVLDVATWQQSMCWWHAKQTHDTIPLVHAAAGITAAV